MSRMFKHHHFLNIITIVSITFNNKKIYNAHNIVMNHECKQNIT